MRDTIHLCAALAFAAAAAAAAYAQDYRVTPHLDPPNELREGFAPDPHVMAVSAGGSEDMRQLLGAACDGFGSANPNAVFSYRAGDRFPLTISAEAEIAATLIVSSPDGAWRCDDLSDGALRIRLAPPPSGQYLVWVGLSEPNTIAPARVLVSELD